MVAFERASADVDLCAIEISIGIQSYETSRPWFVGTKTPR